MEKHKNIDRRSFLKSAGGVGIGSIFAAQTKAQTKNSNNIENKYPQVPRRKLGKTGVEVSSLVLGAHFNFMDKQIVLRKALDWGVNFWDTAANYGGGNSELGIGKFLSKNPHLRKQLFISTKPTDIVTSFPDMADIEMHLRSSLGRMNTSYVDLYFGIHGMFNPAQLNDELRQWVADAKQREVIRYFGVSFHKNLVQNLMAVSKHDWIDAVMVNYNFRLRQDKRLSAAIDRCHKAGIGLIAIKTQGARAGLSIETEEDKKFIGHFTGRGFTQGQAKLKVVLQDEKFTAAAVGMQNVALLTENVAAVLDKTKLTKTDFKTFDQYAQATCNGYCGGCAHICDSALPDVPYVSDIMRYLMYYNGYGETERAKELFTKIPSPVRSKLLSADYSLAEARCPQKLPIRELVSEAVSKLA